MSFTPEPCYELYEYDDTLGSEIEVFYLGASDQPRIEVGGAAI